MGRIHPLVATTDAIGVVVGESKGHRCGNCNWQGKGREDCPNNKQPRRASQQVPYQEPDYPESPYGAL